MRIEVTLFDKDYTSGGCDNVISFAGYIALHGRKTNFKYGGHAHNMVPLIGAEIIYLEDRRI